MPNTKSKPSKAPPSALYIAFEDGLFIGAFEREQAAADVVAGRTSSPKLLGKRQEYDRYIRADAAVPWCDCTGVCMHARADMPERACRVLGKVVGGGR